MVSEKDIFSTTTIGVLFIVLAFAVATDLSHRRIPNALLAPALGIALLLHAMTNGVDGLLAAAAGLSLGLAMLSPLYVVGGMAAGDVKLLGVVGSFLGPWGAIVAGLATLIAGGVFGLTVIAWQCLSTSRLSTSRSTLGTSELGHQRQVTHIPYAPAIAVGTLAACWYLGI